MKHTSLSVTEALKEILLRLELMSSEKIDISEAFGRVLFNRVLAPEDFPHFDSALMDGFAIRSTDAKHISKSNPATFGIVGHIGAGMVFEGTVREGQAVRLMTGCAVPDDTDTIIKLEDTAIKEGRGGIGSTISYGYPIQANQHIAKKGSKVKTGDMIAEEGSIIDSFIIGALATMGVDRVAVFKKPKLAILSLGSELVDAHEPRAQGKIRNSNLYSLMAMARAAGAKPLAYPPVDDDEGAIKELISKACQEADMVVITGGSAGGDFDFTDYVLQDMGELIYTDIEMSPARTQGFACINKTPVFSLPGQPTAAQTAFELLIRPAIRHAGGFGNIYRKKVSAILDNDVKASRNHAYLPLYKFAELYHNRNGVRYVKVAPNKSSLNLALDNINCIAIIPAGEESRRAGSQIEVLSFELL